MSAITFYIPDDLLRRMRAAHSRMRAHGYKGSLNRMLLEAMALGMETKAKREIRKLVRLTQAVAKRRQRR